VFPGAPATIGRGLVASSFQYYLTGDENLRLEVESDWVAARVELAWRFWRESDRTIQLTRQSHLTSDITRSTRSTYKLDAGALLNVRVSTPVLPPPYGMTWVRVQLIRGLEGGTEVIGTLLQGYVSLTNDLNWPGSPIEKQDGSSGVIRQVGFSNNGFDLRATVPTDRRWRVVCGRFAYTTGGVAGARNPFVIGLDAAAAIYWAGIVPSNIPPGSTFVFSFGAGMSPSAVTVVGLFHLPWPNDLEMAAGHQVRASVDGFQAGDSFSNGALVVRQWMDL